METIVLGFDGSDSSMVALDWVAERAAQRRAGVEIVMIGGTLLQDDVGRDDGLISAEHRLHDLAPDTEVETHRFTGKMPEALIERARRADLLVVGAHRGNPVWSALSGWMPLRVASRSRTPVAVVPDDWEPTSAKIVAGVDDDDSSLAALDFAADEAAVARLPLVLVHTWQVPAPRMEGSVALLASPIEARAGHRKILREAAERVLGRHASLVVDQVLEQSTPASALLRAARGASLLVIGTHHRGVIAGTLLGSVGQDVITQCRTPVCVIPAETSS